RRHPVAFLRDDLRQRGMATCADLSMARDGWRLIVPGLVLVRQRPGSASGVMFITLEDETGVANLVIWPSLFERQRRVVLSASMIAAHGRVQREGEVIHLIAEQLTDLTDLLRSVGSRGEPFPLHHGRGDEVRTGAGTERRGRDIYFPDREVGSGIKVPTRDFR
ncbi:MAG: error-prone DNA polymerase, partial [Acetobacteraceae bacterium]|nr:error-prone DNA polymerase [Acetobacteraceae bacterium]